MSAVGMGDDINAIIRTCPSPRDGESELACQVNGGILGAWVGNLATKLSLAASYCASSINVDAICSAGVNGLVSVMGELAATASLAAATCTGTPPQLTTTQISVLGDQTVRGRRLLIGEGAVGNGVQCMVDVGMVASNIANMGLAINSAVNSGNCNWQSLHSPLNKLKGIPEALCTVDIGGAVAYIGQVVTFINLIVVHCQDRRRRMHGGQMPDLQVSANHSCGFRCYDTCCPSVHAHDSHDSFSACSDLSCFEQSMPAHPVKSATIFCSDWLTLQDLLDVNALCAGSIAGITTSAAAVAPYGAAVHAACRYNALTKNGAAQAMFLKRLGFPVLDNCKEPVRVGCHDALLMFFMLAALSLNDLLSVLWLECTRQSRSLKPQPHAAAVLFWCTAVAGGEGGGARPSALARGTTLGWFGRINRQTGSALEAKINSLYDVPDRPRRLEELAKPVEAACLPLTSFGFCLMN